MASHRPGQSTARGFRRLALCLCLLAACGQEKSRQNHGDDAPAPPSVFRPEEGRLVGVDWSDASSPLLDRATTVRRSAIEAVGGSREQASIGQLRADAVLSLLRGDPDGAVTRLSRAIEIDPNNEVVWNDLAATRLQRSQAFSDPYDLFLALAAANRALSLDPELLAARYNRALALQRLSLSLRARAEWQRYQERETDSSWWDAAQAHATALVSGEQSSDDDALLEAAQQAAEREDQQEVEKIVARSPRVFREHAERTLLTDWAEAEGEGRKVDSRRALSTARAIGSALAVSNGERMVADTIAQIDTLRQTSPQDLARLIEGFRTYKQGIARTEQGDFGAALPLLWNAHRLLAEQRSPFAGWITYWIAVCRYQHADYDQTLALLRPLHEDPDHTRHAALLARARWLEGLIAIIRGDPAAALNAYEAALLEFQKLREHSHAARMAGQVANTLDILGRRSDAWRHLQPALVEPAIRKTPYSRLSLYQTASSLARRDGENEIALWFQEEAVRSALDAGTAAPTVVALRWDCEILLELGRKEAAARELEQARQTLNEVPDPEVRAILDGDLRLVEARLAPSPQEALARLNDAIRVFRKSSDHYLLAQALFERSRAHQALGDSSNAEHDLAGAIEEFEAQRSRIGNPEERISYFDRAGEILDAMVLLQIEQRGRPDIAFSYSEQSKSRALLDWILTHPFGDSVPAEARTIGPGTTDPSSLQGDLPADTVLVEYAVLPRTLVIWILRRDGLQVETTAIDAQNLEMLVRQLSHDLVLERQKRFQQTSARLYEKLILPIEKHLSPGDRIVFVPDGALHSLPFSTLRDARTGRYLVQDHVCSITPSARLLIASLHRDEELARRRDPRALVFVDPAFDQEIFPTLDRLKSSRKEALVAGFFPGSRVLEDQDATRDAFLQNAGAYEILHFGGHSLVNVNFPLLSQMLFAADPNDPARGILYSGDLLGQRFERTRLAVLASCSTASGRISRTEGVQSLARPFLAAGVPAVIASLWDVEDQRTAELFGRFYRHLHESFDPAAALQKAQVESIEQRTTKAAGPWAWGAFEVIGGSSPGR